MLEFYYKVNGGEPGGYNSANFVNDKDMRESVSGYVLLYVNGGVLWGVRKQQITSLSTTEAQYTVSCEEAKEAT